MFEEEKRRARASNSPEGAETEVPVRALGDLSPQLIRLGSKSTISYTQELPSFGHPAAHQILLSLGDCAHPFQLSMGKLNIAHHKSYHPYRRDNIERVRRDEEEARMKEAVQEGRMMLAVCESLLSSPS